MSCDNPNVICRGSNIFWIHRNNLNKQTNAFIFERVCQPGTNHFQTGNVPVKYSIHLLCTTEGRHNKDLRQRIGPKEDETAPYHARRRREKNPKSQKMVAHKLAIKNRTTPDTSFLRSKQSLCFKLRLCIP